jgi:hypothetical protein
MKTPLTPLAGLIHGIVLLLLMLRSAAADPVALVTDEDTPLRDVPFRITVPGFTNPVITVTTVSTNPLLLPATAVLVRGQGLERRLEFLPGTDQAGLVHITLQLKEPVSALTATQEFSLVVQPVDDPPRLDPVADRVWYEGATLPPVPIRVTDPDGGILRVSAELERGARDFFGQTTLKLVPPISPGERRYDLFFPGTRVPLGFGTYRISATDGRTTNHVSFTVVTVPRQFLPIPNGMQIGSLPVDLGDVLADGYPDLLLPGLPGSGTGLPGFGGPQTIGNQAGRFTGSGLGTIMNPEPVVWDDFDGNGVLDAVVASIQYQQLQFWKPPGLNPQAGTRRIASTNPLPVIPGVRLFSADFDGNGSRDVLIVNPASTKEDAGVWLARKVLADRFELERVAGAVPGALAAVGDLNGDGSPDVVAYTTNPTPALVAWLNDGQGHFRPAPLPGLPSGAFTGMGLVDANADGHLDLWTTEGIGPAVRSAQTNRLTVLGSNGRGFTPVWSLDSGYAVEGSTLPVWGDFDADGFLDVVAPAQLDGQPGLFHFHQVDEWQFKAESLVTGRQNSIGPAVADLNGDSRPDLMLGSGSAGGSTPFAQYLSNGIPSFNPPPGVPSSLRARLDGTRLTLQWDPASDLFQNQGLTYNVRAGFKSGREDLVASLSLPTGARLLTRPGNAGPAHSLSLDLSGREGEVVYWSVQAVDAAGQGSAFAMELATPVRLTGAPPMITGLAGGILAEDAPIVRRFRILDEGSGPLGLTAKATAEPPDFLANLRIDPPALASLNPQYTLSAVPQPNRHGSVTITVTATDLAGYSTSQALVFQFQPVNDPPQLETIAPRFSFTGEVFAPFRITVSDPETPIEALRPQFKVIPATALDPASLRTRVVSPTEWEISAPDARLQPGHAEIELTVFDPEQASVAQVFHLETFPRLLPELTSFPAPEADQLHLGDYDQDGQLDLLARSSVSGSPVLWHQDTPTSWTIQTLPWPTALRADSVQWEDWNQDGRLDVVARVQTAPEGLPRGVVVLLNQASGWTATPVATPLPGEFVISSLSDLDDNGQLDAVGAPLSGGAWRVAYRKGEFQPSVAAPFAGGLVEALDLDLDGRTDFVTAAGQLQWVHQAEGDAGYLTDALKLPLQGRTVFADFDRDGQWDALLPGMTHPETSAEYRRALIAASDSSTAGFPVQQLLRLTDLDADKRPDALVRSTDGRLAWHAWQPEGWQPRGKLGLDPVLDATSGDLDGDGVPETVAVVGTNPGEPAVGPRVIILRGVSSSGPLASPEPPLQPTVVLEADGAFLHWQPADSHAGRGVTYQVRLGTQPGLGDVLSSESTVTGRRLRPEPGNAGLSTVKRVTGLLVGRTYYAAVQAIDLAGQGGAFSAETAFEYRAHQLFVSVPGEVVTGPDEVQVQIPVAFSGGTGSLTTELSFSPRPLTTESGPSVEISGPGTMSLKVPFRDHVQGKASLLLTVTDSTGMRVRRRISLAHGEAGSGADLLYQPPLSVRADQPRLLPIAELGDTQGWELLDVTLPNVGAIQGEFPNLRYVPLPGWGGRTEPFQIVLWTDAGQVLVARFVAEVNGAQAGRARVHADGRLDYTLRGSPGQQGRLEVSTDLVNWTDLGSFTLPPSGSLDFEALTYTTQGPQKFIRVRIP